MRRILTALVLIGSAMTAACAGDRVRPDDQERPTNVIIIVIDALRADKLGCYGSEKAVTPEIDALASNGLMFTAAYSNATYTFPSTASLFTSTQPTVHRITHDPEREKLISLLSDAYVMLPEVFKAAGYTTGLLTFPGWVSPTANYMQGVDVKAETERSDAAILDLAETFIDDHGDNPFFLYLHFVDMHDYWFPRYLFENVDPESLGLSPELMSLQGMKLPEAYDSLAKVLNQPGRLTERDLQHLHHVYDTRLTETDRIVGELTRYLADAGLTDETILVITSDHGEQFLEHGRLVHGGDAFYNELIHIPFLVSNPSLYPDGLRASTPITSIDFAPTILDLVGLEIPGVYQGESLAHRHDEDRVVFATDGRTWKALSREWSYIRSEELGREELYNLVDDPGETVNLVASEPEIVDIGRRQVHWMNEECRRHPYRSITVDQVTMPDDQIDRLRSLGYLQ